MVNDSRAPAGARSPVKYTVGILLVLAVATGCLLPFSGIQGLQIPGINAFLGAGVFIADLATSLLLFLRFRQTGNVAVLILVCAYALSSLLALVYCLTFPGAMLNGEPLIGNLVSVAWVFTSWMVGYPVLCLLAVVTPRQAQIARSKPGRAALLTGAWVLLTAIAIVVAAVMTRDRLPTLVVGSSWSAWDLILSYAASGASLASVVLILLTPRRRDELMLWLSIALFTMACGNLLSTIGGGRYTVGWYAFRLSWICSSCMLFLYFMLQFARQQAMLARAIDNLKERTRERDRIWSVSEDLLAVSDFAGYFHSMNPAWTKTLGWSEAEMRAMHVSALRHPDDEAVATAARLSLAQGTGTVRVENRFRHKDGSWRWIAWTATSDSGLLYVAGRDITGEREAQEERRKAELARAHSQKIEALGQLTGGVAHDFNNLLMIVGGHIGRLKAAVAGNARAQRAAEAIETAAQRGEALTRQLLRFSRRQPTNPDTVNIAARLETLRPMLLSSLGTAIALQIDLPTDLWNICVDPSEFDLAIVNLVINARDALAQGGTVRIAARNARLPQDAAAGTVGGDAVALSISDNGSGIAPDIVPRVFDPFFTTKETGKGTGLGLSQVHGFAHQSGGSVTLDSTLGRGTAVTLWLPRGDAVARPADMAAAGKTGGGKVLLVEDNPNVAELSREMLGDLGYAVWLASDAAAALSMLEGQVFDLILSDIIMAGPMNGLDLARRIRRRRPAQAILLVTGYSESAEAAMAEFPVLRKPYREAELRQAIARAAAKAGEPASAGSASP